MSNAPSDKEPSDIINAGLNCNKDFWTSFGNLIIINDLHSKGLIDKVNNSIIDSLYKEKEFELKQFKFPENTSGLLKVSREKDGTLCLHTKASIFKINVTPDFRIVIEHKDNRKPYVNDIQMRNPVEIVYK